MKLVTYLDGQLRVGAVVGSGVVDLSERFDSMLALIEEGEPALEEAASSPRRPIRWQRSRGQVTGSDPASQEERLLYGVELPDALRGRARAPRRPGRGVARVPTFFDKPTTTVIGPYDDIPFDPNFSEKIDYEAELAIVMGRAGRSIPAAEAMDHIFGYTVANDVTARDVQRRHGGQWLKGKGMDGSCPLGPWIVTADEIVDPQNLQVQCHVNGVEKQNSNTRFMVFPIARLIEELSLAMTLLPGDILLTGTPEGVGYARTPPEYLSPATRSPSPSPVSGDHEQGRRTIPHPLGEPKELTVVQGVG